MTDDELDRLFALIRVPSISALPEHAGDMETAAALVCDEILRADGTAEIVRNGGHPLVVGEVAASVPSNVTVLIYGHYDVQPIGDPDLWESPPFTPTIRGAHLYARGASDDKGNLFMLMVAVQRLAAQGRLPVRVRFLVEGEEESGGDSATRWLAADAEGADCCLIYDSGMVTPELPAIYTGTRGMLYRRIRVRTAERDGHSGIYGGAALNATQALVSILAKVSPTSGRVCTALQTGAVAPTAPERAAWDSLPSGADALAEGGLRPGDASAAEEFHLRTGFLPALDVHGLASGEPGAVKTVIPREATATLSLRLAPGQVAADMAPVLDRLLREAAPSGCGVEIERLGDADPVLVAADSPWLTRTADGIEAAIGTRPAFVRTGGSIPIMAHFAARGITPILTGFALPDDAIHAPNERMRVANLELGVRAAIGILEALAGDDARSRGD